MTNNEKIGQYTIEAAIHAGSSRRGIVARDGKIHIYTNRKPIKGEANADAAALISEYLNVPKKAVSILKGERSKNKVFLVDRLKRADRTHNRSGGRDGS